MEIKASVKQVRIGTLKAKPVVNLIRGKSVHDVTRILSVQNKKASQILKKLVESAIANAEQRKTVDIDKLYVKEIFVNRGPHRKSFMPRARGRASSIIKRSSHISIVLDER